MAYLVQVGKGSKGSYNTRYTFNGLEQARRWYECIHIGLNYKKRLVEVSEDGTRKTLDRAS